MRVSYDDILIPTDGSEGTRVALDHAATVATDHGATVHALYVVNKRLYLATEKDERDGAIEKLENRGEDAVESVTERMAEDGLDVVSAVADGVPHREILSYAGTNDADLVVMGTRGKTGRDRLVNLGSVAEKVVGGADVPVLTVPIAEDG